MVGLQFEYLLVENLRIFQLSVVAILLRFGEE